MTRTTFKALWIGGSGVLATWLAVSPNPGVPPTPPAAAVRRAASAAEPTAEELNVQAARLRKRTAAVTLRPSTRNPFRYGSPKSSAPRASRERARSIGRDRAGDSSCATGAHAEIVRRRAEGRNAHRDSLRRRSDLCGWRRGLGRRPLHRHHDRSGDGSSSRRRRCRTAARPAAVISPAGDPLPGTSHILSDVIYPAFGD